MSSTHEVAAIFAPWLDVCACVKIYGFDPRVSQYVNAVSAPLVVASVLPTAIHAVHDAVVRSIIVIVKSSSIGLALHVVFPLSTQELNSNHVVVILRRRPMGGLSPLFSVRGVVRIIGASVYIQGV